MPAAIEPIAELIEESLEMFRRFSVVCALQEPFGVGGEGMHPGQDHMGVGRGTLHHGLVDVAVVGHGWVDAQAIGLDGLTGLDRGANRLTRLSGIDGSDDLHLRKSRSPLSRGAHGDHDGALARRPPTALAAALATEGALVQLGQTH